MIGDIMVAMPVSAADDREGHTASASLTIIVHFGRLNFSYGVPVAIVRPQYSLSLQGDPYATCALLRRMAEGEDNDPPTSSEDRLIDSKAFQLGGGIDLDAFMTSEDLSKAKRPALPGG